MNAAQITQQLLSGQVGDPAFMGYESVGHYGNPYVGDLVAVQPVYPGGRVGSPNVNPYYPGVGLPAVAEQSAQGQVNYSPPQYVAGDVTYLGFAATTIPAGSTGTIVNVSTQRPFTPQKMGCPSTTIGLLIGQINISGTNLLANSLGIPIELFSEVSTFPQILWPTLDTATGVQFVVYNPTAGDLTFSGAFYGTQVRR
jgi:hypothetical protein